MKNLNAYSLGYVQCKLSHLDQKNYFLDKSRSKQLQEYHRHNHQIRLIFDLNRISLLFPSFLRNKISLENEKADCPHSSIKFHLIINLLTDFIF